MEAVFNILIALGVLVVLGIVAGVVFGLAGTVPTEEKKVSVAEKKNEEFRAFVRCSGGDAASRRYTYADAPDCQIADSLYGGLTICSYACLGLGNCKAVCKNGAIEIKKGVAHVVSSMCNGCGKCVSACPRGIISLIPKCEENPDACSNPEGVCSFASEFDGIEEAIVE